LCEAAGGFYFVAEEAADGESLRRMGVALAEHLGVPARLEFGDGHEVIDALLALGDERPRSRARLLLCGSAMSFMGRLLGGSAPLRGRASLELVVPTLDYPLAAQFCRCLRLAKSSGTRSWA
jgi:uncharacterized protein